MNGSFENCRSSTQLFIDGAINDDKSDLVDIGGIIFIFLNAILAVTATLGNGVIIIAILRSPNLQTPSYLLITSLSFTDLLVGFMLHPLQVVGGTFLMQSNIRGLCTITPLYVFLVNYLCSVSLTIMTCISIDRYLALTLRHRYAIIVTKKRVRFLVVFVLLFSFTGGVTSIFEQYENIYSSIIFSLYFVLLFIICVSYIKSFRALHRYTVQVQVQQPNPLAGNLDVVRYKKTMKTMLVVLACFGICYVPPAFGFSLSKELDFNQSKAIIVYFISVTLMCLNSSINPVVYLVRFTDIRNSCREMWKK